MNRHDQGTDDYKSNSPTDEDEDESVENDSRESLDAQQIMGLRMEMWMSPALSMVKQRTVLLVDDDPQIRRLMERCLGASFDEVVTASDALSAFEILKAKRVTHILSDLFFDNQPPVASFASICLWRVLFPSIERCVIFTARDVPSVKSSQTRMFPHTADAVDVVLSKMDGVDAVIEALLGEGQDEG